MKHPATVEAITELVQILLEIFTRHTMICARQEGLEIADGDMHPRQPFARLVCGRHARRVVLGFPQRRQAGGEAAGVSILRSA